MKKILLSLGAMMAIATPVVVAVSCNDDVEKPVTPSTPAVQTEYTKIAYRMSQMSPSTHSESRDTDTSIKTLFLTWSFPKEFGMSSPDVLNKIEAEVNKMLDDMDPESDNYDFTAGTYSSDNHVDDHIEFTLYSSNLVDIYSGDTLMSALNTHDVINSIINTIKAIPE